MYNATKHDKTQQSEEKLCFIMFNFFINANNEWEYN